MRIFPILAAVLLLIVLSTSLLVFMYPLEIETRESGVWLHVLALKKGIDIYDHRSVAFVNNTHGPFEQICKFAIASLFPFLEPWQVTRLPVFLLPYLFLLIAWELLAGSARRTFPDGFFLGSLGFILITLIPDNNMSLVGRSDSTAMLFFLPLLCLSTSFSPRIRITLRGLACGVIGACIALSNWRFLPTLGCVLLFSLWQYRYEQKAGPKQLLIYVLSYLLGLLTVCGAAFWLIFHFDFNLYYKHSLSFVLKPKEWGITFGGSRGFFQKSAWPIFAILAVYLTIPEKKKTENAAWAVLSLCVLAINAINFYFNQDGGGVWYFIPSLTIVWFFFARNYGRITRKTAGRLGMVILAFYLILTLSDSGGFPLRLARTMKKAGDFMEKVRLLDGVSVVASEDLFFFRNVYKGERIDLGDHVYSLASRGFLDKDFADTAGKHFTTMISRLPDFVICGFTISPVLENILVDNYELIEAAPDNLIADRKVRKRFRSQLYKRNDIILP